MLGGLGNANSAGNGNSLLSGGLTGGGGGGPGNLPGMPNTGSFLYMQNNLNSITGAQGGPLLSGALSAATGGAANNCNNL
jgi:hypothetical protein